jgi:ATP-dependent Lhr-like helicase
MPRPESYALSDATRRVLLGATPANVRLSKRAVTKLGELREEYAHRVSGDSTVLFREPNGRLRCWTWAGDRANAVLVAGLLEVAPELLDESRAFNNWQIGLRVTPPARLCLRPCVKSGVCSKTSRKGSCRRLMSVRSDH